DIALQCVVTNTPLGAPPLTGSRTENIRASIQRVTLAGGTEVQALTYSQDVTRVEDVLAELTELAELPVTVIVTTDLQTYENMSVVSVSRARSAETGTAVTFDVKLREVRRAEVEVKTAPRPRLPRNRAGIDRGVQATKPTEKEQQVLASLPSEHPLMSVPQNMSVPS